MGQYNYPICPTKRQYIHPHRFGDGLKLMEFGASGSGTMLGLAALLASSNGRGGGDLRSDDPIIGSWAGEPIVIAGDYSDEGQFVSPEDLCAYRLKLGVPDANPNLYNVAAELYEDVSDKVIRALCADPYERKALVERGAEAAIAFVKDGPSEGAAFAPV
jgi:hypothetical protein